MARILVVTLQLQLVGPKQFEDWNLGCYPKLQLVGPKQSGSMLQRGAASIAVKLVTMVVVVGLLVHGNQVCEHPAIS